MGVGTVYPWSATARNSAPDSPSLVKGMTTFVWVSSHTPPRGRPVTAKREKLRGRNETESTAARGLEQGPQGALYTTMGSRKILTPQELEQLADRTLEHYRENAEEFREGTRDHDVSQNIATLL